MARQKDAALNVKIGGSTKAFEEALKKTERRLDGFGKNITRIGAAIGLSFGVDQLINLGTAVVNTRSEFQKFEAVLTNTLGSESKAQKSLSQINDFVAKTPFQVDEVTGAFVKLANQGFAPTVNQLTKLGDLAASTGKGFDQLSEAIIDAQVGEFERLKEFGIRAQKQGDQVMFTFKGVKTQVDFTTQSIQDYVLGLGDAVGVSGSMDKISQTLGGQLSNLDDNFTTLRNNLGKLIENEGQGFLGWLNEALSGLNQVIAKSADPFKGLVINSDNLSEMEGAITALQKERSELQKDIARLSETPPSQRAYVENTIVAAKERLALVNKALDEQYKLLQNVAKEQSEVNTETEAAVPYLKALEDKLKETTAARDALASGDPVLWADFNRRIDEITEKIQFLKSVTVTDIPSAIPKIAGQGRDNIITEPKSGLPQRTGEELFGLSESAMDSVNEKLAEMQRLGEDLTPVFYALGNTMGNVFEGLGEALAGSADGMKKAFSSIIRGIGDVIGALVQQAVAAAIANTMIASAAAGPVGLALAAAAGAAAKGLISGMMSNAVPSLAVGTNMVQSDGLAMIHRGEEIRPAKVVGGGYKQRNEGGTMVLKAANIGRELMIFLERQNSRDTKLFGA